MRAGGGRPATASVTRNGSDVGSSRGDTHYVCIHSRTPASVFSYSPFPPFPFSRASSIFHRGLAIFLRTLPFISFRLRDAVHPQNLSFSAFSYWPSSSATRSLISFPFGSLSLLSMPYAVSLHISRARDRRILCPRTMLPRLAYGTAASPGAYAARAQPEPLHGFVACFAIGNACARAAN